MFVVGRPESTLVLPLSKRHAGPVDTARQVLNRVRDS